MSDSSDPGHHQQLERQFMGHVDKLLLDERLRVDTSRGRRSVVTLVRDVTAGDHGVELKRLMSEMGKPDRELESHMPVGKSLDVTLSRRKWWVLKKVLGRLRVTCLSPSRALLAGQTAQPMSAADVAKALAEVPPPLGGAPVTVILMSTCGFTQEASESAQRNKDRTVILAAPNAAGGWTVTAPPEARAMAGLLDPEADLEKRARLRAEIAEHRAELLSAGIAAEKLAAELKLPPQWVESELKSYARENPGLTAKRISGRVVLFREGSAPLAGPASGGLDMPFIDRLKTLFSRKGEVEKKISFLSERRADLSQQLERGYEDMGALEGKETQLRQQFRDATGDLTRRRITSQILQLHKDLERRQQLLSVLNQQINVVGTHLHNLELQQQGKAASLPDSEEMAADAAAAEEVLAELQAGNELAESVGPASHAGMSAQEQALYEELLSETKQAQPPAPAEPAPAPKAAAPAAAKPPPIAQPRRNEPEAG